LSTPQYNYLEQLKVELSKGDPLISKLFAVLSILVISAFAIAGQTKEWIKYESPEGRYSVLVPVEPTVSKQDATSGNGDPLAQYLASAPDGNGVFMIGYFDYLPAMTFSLDKARDEMVTAMSATLLGEEVVSLGGSAGRSLKLLAKASDGQEFIDRARIYDVAKRVYVVQCIFPKSEEGPAVLGKCDKFFASFKNTTP
jgi:hypothetical protein